MREEDGEDLQLPQSQIDSEEERRRRRPTIVVIEDTFHICYN
jgi:hypothetical protein